MGSKLKTIEQGVRNKLGEEIYCTEWHSSIVLEGIVKEWNDVVRAGKYAANRGYKGVVNKIEVKNLQLLPIRKPILVDNLLDNRKVDVLIIGGGIIGSAIARELSKWNISILLLDKECDLAMNSSSRNDGMVHPGFEPKPGSNKAFYNVRGNELYSRITKELDVPFKRCGSSILFDRTWKKLVYPIIKDRANKNGVTGISLLSKEMVKKLEPNILDDIAGAIHFSSTGILSPYKMTIAYAENAVENGAEVSLNTIVLGMEKHNSKINSVITNRGKIHPKVVINAAGIFADEIANMAGDQFFTIHPRKGQIVFLDKKAGKLINGVVAKPDLSITRGNTKGGGLVKTIDENILVGPDAYEQPHREDYSTDRENIDRIIKKHLPLIPGLNASDVITYCAGNRAATYEEDFIIEKSQYVDNFVYAAGMQSPGLASAPAVAEKIEELTLGILKDQMETTIKNKWNPYRKGIPHISQLNLEERSALIKKRSDYGIIVCRCEEISKGEIIDALNSPIPIDTVDGIKRRVRAGMGRCQGGFCLPHIMEIIAEDKKEDMCLITKKGNDSNILSKPTKGNENKSRGDDGGAA